MASQNNFFALLVDDENDDPAALFARAVSPKGAGEALVTLGAAKQLPRQQAAKLPAKPLPPSQAVRGVQQAQSEAGRGRGNRGSRGGGRGNFGSRGRGQDGGGFQGDRGNFVDRSYSNNRENIDTQGESRVHLGENGEGGRLFNAPRMPARGRSRGRGFGFVGDGEERQRTRFYDRRSGTGRGNEIKRDGSGRGNWGTETDRDLFQEIVDVSFAEEEKPSNDSGDKKPEEAITSESATAEEKTADEDDNVMTLDEYEKLLIEKRKPLEALKLEERKVLADKEFESMQLVDKRHDDDDADVFLKPVFDSEKGKKKQLVEKEEKVKKAVSINEFLKPAEGEEYYSPGRRGRGRGERGGFRAGFGGRSINGGQILAPHIEDPGQFPTLSGK